MKGKKKKKNKDEDEESGYLPDFVLEEAKYYLKRVNEDVEVYRKIRMLECIPANDEADGFSLWWNFQRYLDNPKSLGVILDYYDEITESLSNEGILSSFMMMQKKMVLLYRLMKKNNFIGERI